MSATTKPRKYAVKKYDGDDQYSYALFYAEDVKGKGSTILYGEAKPICSGMSRTEANFEKLQFTRRAQK